MKARRLKPLRALAVILSAVLLVDVVAAASVYVKRREARVYPQFTRADISGVDWDVEPYPSAKASGFTVEIGEPGKVTRAGRITYRENAVSPPLNAMYVIAALEKARTTGNQQWLDRAETAMNQVLRTAQDGFLPHQFSDTDVFGRDLPHPWYSSQAQGLVLSALARLYEVTGDVRWRTQSDAVFAAMTTFRAFLAGSKPAAEPWLNVVDADGYLWFEQFTHGQAPAKVVSNQIYATIGIYDYHRVLADRPAEKRRARAMFAGGLATVAEYAPKTRTPGKISRSSLAVEMRDPGAHAFVERQLDIFTRITGDESFERLSRLLDRDDNLPVFNVMPVRIREPDVSPYQPLPDEAQFTTRPKAPTTATPSGRVTYRDGEVNAGASASYALAAMDTYDATGRQVWLSRAEQAVRHVLATSRSGGLIPYRFPNTDIYGTPLPVPWYSSEGQGLMLSALARLTDATGDPIWSQRARAVFGALTRVRTFGPDGSPPPRAWLSFVDDDGYLWFEQYAGGFAASAVVPGHLAALLGIYDYWRISHDVVAKQLFKGGTTTVKHYLPRIRRDGRAPWYAVGNKSSDSRFDATVTRQLVTLGRITEDKQIQRFSVR